MKLLTIKNILLIAEVSTKARRSLGIGYIGLAHYLAKLKLSYNDKQAWKEVDELTENFQYYLLKQVMRLQKKKVNVIISTRQSIQTVSFQLIPTKKKLMKFQAEN